MNSKKVFVLAGLIFFSGVAVSAVEPLRVHADRFELNGKTSEVLVTGNVSIQREAEQISSKYAVYRQDLGELKLGGDVTLKSGEIVLNAAQVRAYPDKDSVFAEGQVTFNYQPYFGKADRAELNRKMKRVNLEGNAYLVKGTERIMSDKLIFDLENNTIKSIGNSKLRVQN